MNASMANVVACAVPLKVRCGLNPSANLVRIADAGVGTLEPLQVYRIL